MTNSEKKILIVEDEITLCEMLSTVLKDEGYLIETASNGSEALELMNKNNYDLLVTDLYMPVMNGFDLISASKKIFPKTKIILMSGGGRDFEAENGGSLVKFKDQEIMVNTFLKKPCNLVELLTSIEKLFQN